jgi:hypothetical protein
MRRLGLDETMAKATKKANTKAATIGTARMALLLMKADEWC